MKKFLLIGALVTCLTLGSSLLIYNKVTDGFNTHQIYSSLSKKYVFSTRGDADKIKFIFERPFTYIGKGAQCYVFESENGEYVLKFFKNKHLKSLHWLRHLPLPSSWVEKKISKRDHRIENLFSSCALSYDQLSEECGVIFVHLNREPFIHHHITIIDKLGFPQWIYIDEFPFIIQKKAVPLGKIFKKIQEGEKICTIIEEICHLITIRMKKGVGDSDPALIKNMAFQEDEKRALFIDIGTLYIDQPRSEKEIQKELEQRLQDISMWAEKHAPHILPYLEEKQKNLLEAVQLPKVSAY